jgi:hypothetical protein
MLERKQTAILNVWRNVSDAANLKIKLDRRYTRRHFGFQIHKTAIFANMDTNIMYMEY